MPHWSNGMRTARDGGLRTVPSFRVKDPISKVRQRTVGQRGRQAARHKPKVPFKDGTWLAVFYNVAFLALVMAVLWSVERGRLQSSGEGWLASIRMAGSVVMAVYAVLGTRILLQVLAPRTLQRNSRTLLLCVISLVSMLATGAVVHATGTGGLLGNRWAFLAPFLCPYTLAPVLATLLLGVEAGVVTGIGTSLLMALFMRSEDALLVLILGLLASMVAPQLVHRKVRKRSQLLRAAFVVALVLTVGVYLAAWILSDRGMVPVGGDGQWSPVLAQAAACLLSGAGCAVLALLLLPVLEHLFGATSNIALQAFADLGHPLLERLCQEAPGTYSHVITVATLSSVAADRIGANPLLARVGAYYHDIGKLSAPALFIENTTPDRNPHRTLKPTTSASWVRSHVKDGVVLADRFRLPPPVKDILWEHHGTTTIASFLHKAREQARLEGERLPAGSRRIIVEESQFRYSGPRPTSKESAIIMLADSVEAAARSLERPTPPAIEGLVSGIVESKLKDEQLDNSPLTLRELATVKQSFVATLSTILHARIAYPNPGERPDDASEDREPTEPVPSES